MKYSVIHSDDPYLLARMATDLQMEGYAERWFAKDFESSPFDEGIKWIDVNPEGCMNHFEFHNVPQDEIDCNKHELTESNYLHVLESVLS